MQTVETLNEGLKRAYTLNITAKDIDARVDAEMKRSPRRCACPASAPARCPPTWSARCTAPRSMQDALNNSIQEGVQKLIAEQQAASGDAAFGRASTTVMSSARMPRSRSSSKCCPTCRRPRSRG